MVDRQRTEDRPWLYYKLTNEPKGSGELKKKKKKKQPEVPTWHAICQIACETFVRKSLLKFIS